MDLIPRTVPLANGIRLSYVEHGDPAGVPVILLHGYTDSWRSYERVLPELPAFVRAFALSQRGHGDSDRPDSGYLPEDLARDVAAFMDALGLERAVVVGHSMGGSVAQRFAVDHPDRLLGLVLVGARAAWHDQPDVAALIAHVDSLPDEPVDRQFVTDFQLGTIAQPVPPDIVATAVAESLKLPARIWRAVATQGVQQADLRGVLAGVRAPTLLICGEHDWIARDGQPALAECIPCARRISYPHAGHALHWEEPARFAEDLASFLVELGYPSVGTAGRSGASARREARCWP